MKTKSPKSRKIGIFPKGLSHGFGQEIAIFTNFSFYAISFFNDILERKNAFLGFKNKKFKKSKKLTFFHSG